MSVFVDRVTLLEKLIIVKLGHVHVPRMSYSPFALLLDYDAAHAKDVAVIVRDGCLAFG